MSLKEQLKEAAENETAIEFDKPAFETFSDPSFVPVKSPTVLPEIPQEVLDYAETFNINEEAPKYGEGTAWSMGTELTMGLGATYGLTKTKWGLKEL